MKNNKTVMSLGQNIFYGLVMMIGLQSCNNDDDGEGKFQGCGLERTTYQEVVNLEGTISYFDGPDVYAVRYAPEPEEGANIDTVIYGILCDLEEDLKTTGAVVVFSGTLENLTEKETNLFEPIPSGTELFVLDHTKLELKP